MKVGRAEWRLVLFGAGISACSPTASTNGAPGAPNLDGGIGPEDGAPGTNDAAQVDGGAEAATDAKTESDTGADASSGKRIFVTSATHSADLKTEGNGVTGLEGADHICATAAMTAHLGGTWKAWLSDSSTDAIDRIADMGPWHQVAPSGGNALVLFANKASLATVPQNPIARDENGQLLANPQNASSVSTGTLAGGRKAPSTCEDWTSTGPYGIAGNYASTSSDWTAVIDDYCGRPKRLYCIEQ